MHSLTLKELKRIQAIQGTAIERIEKEKPTPLPENRVGSYDFLTRSKSGTVGFEVMTRPTKGKLKEKLRYRALVDKYVFVIPFNALGIYRKRKKRGYSVKARPKYFPKEFHDLGLRAWLLDTTNEKFTKKGAFHRIFNVKEK